MRVNKRMNHNQRIEIIRKVLESLNQAEIGYCVLRNYDFLISEEKKVLAKSEKSIDMTVAKKDYDRFKEVMQSIGFRRRGKLSFSHAHKPFFTIVNGEIISFDVQVGGVYWNDIRYIEDRKMIESREKKVFFYVPSKEDSFVMLLTHSIVGKRYFKPEYRERLDSLVGVVNVEEVIRDLSSIFSKRKAMQLFSLVKKRKYDQIIAQRFNLIALFVTKKKNNLITLAKVFLRWVAWKKIGASYPLISIIGPDGAGKSTAAKNIVMSVKDSGRKALAIYTGRGKNQILPIARIGKMYKRREKTQQEKANHSVKKVSEKERNNLRLSKKILYTLGAFVFTIDLLLRYFFVILPKRKTGHVIVTDRYSSDIIVMEYVPFWIRKSLLYLFPKPTITFYLYNDVGVLKERRPEESAKGLERQMKYFERIIPYVKAIKIKSEEEKEVSNKMKKVIFSYLLDHWY